MIKETRETVELEVNNEGIATITLKQITFNQKMIREFDEFLDILEKTQGPMCLITKSSHQKIFSAGLNLAIFKEHIAAVGNFLNEFSRLIGRLLELPFPSIAAINGHLVAGGVMFAMAHDYRIMIDGNFKVLMNEVINGLGIPRNMGAAIFAKLKPQTLRDLNLMGMNFTPAKALQEEMIDSLVPNQETLDKKVLELANSIKELGDKRLGYKAIKISLYKDHIAMTRAVCEEESFDALGIYKAKL